jgi:phosphate transport system permease protein
MATAGSVEQMFAAGASPLSTAPRAAISGRASSNWERLIESSLFICSLTAIVSTIGIVVILTSSAAEFFSHVSLSQFFGDTQWTPLFSENQHFGIWPLIAGTLITTAIALAVAIPLGLLGAVYLSEYAAPRTRKIVKPALELLAGVPTVVYGFFALTVVTPALKEIIPGLSGFNALAPGLVMGIMIVPLICSLSEDAIFAVPQHLREAAYGLGADRVQTIFRVIIPAAWSGIAAAFTLAISRAVGETMIVAIAAGQSTKLVFDPRGPMETQTAFIADVAKGDLPTGSIGYQSIFAVGLVLFAFTLVLNLISFRMSRRLRAQARA